MLLLRSEFIQT